MIVKNIVSLKKIIEDINLKKKICFIPTLGNLHKGHLSLVENAKKKRDFVVVSIFINPLQFEKKRDFESYPKTLKNDLDILKKNKVDLIFLPPKNFVSSNLSIVKVNKISEKLCGIDRTGHFEGVATIILKFLRLIKPNKIILGEKDFQQILIIKQVIKDFFLSTKVIVLPTIRDMDGLALSSRNSLMSNNKRKLASILYESLKKICEEIINTGIIPNRIDYYKIKILKAGFEKVNYLEILKDNDLSILDEKPSNARIFISADISGIRLIDNLKIKRKIRIVKGIIS